MQSSQKVSRKKKRTREDGGDPGNVPQSASVARKKKSRNSSNGRTDEDTAGDNVESSVKLVDSIHDGSAQNLDKRYNSQSPKPKKKRKKQSGVQEGPTRQYEAQSRENLSVDSRMEVFDEEELLDEEESDPEDSDFDEYRKLSKANESFTKPRSKLELVRLLQTPKIPRLRKIEVVCEFIKEWGETRCKTPDGSCLKDQATKADMGMPQFITFLSEWVQNAILWSAKELSLECDDPDLLPHLWDSRYWDTLGWCLSSKDLPQSASIWPGLMGCLKEYLEFWFEDEVAEGKVMTEDSIKSIEVLLLANQRSFRPDLDHWVSLAVTALTKLSFEDDWYALEPLEDCIVLFRVFVQILEGFSRFIAIYPNRKKTFLCLVDKLLEHLLSAHACLTLPSDYAYLTTRSDLVDERQALHTGELEVWRKRFLKVTEEILDKGLFHPVHIGSFHEVCTFLSTQVDAKSDVRSAKVHPRKTGRWKKEDEERDLTSYQKLLFRKLDYLRQQSRAYTSVYGLRVTQIGWIFRTYCQNLTTYQAADALEIFGLKAKGKLQVSPYNANVQKLVNGTEEESGKLADILSAGPKSVDQKDQPREARFSVFAELTGPIVTDLQACWSATTGEKANYHLSRAEILLGAFTGLLKAAVMERTYVPTEDSSRQTHFTFLSKCFGVVIDFGNLLPGLLNDSDVGISQNADNRPKGGLVRGNQDTRISRFLIGRLLRQIILATAHLLELEYRVADNLLNDVWAILLHGAVLQESCMKAARAENANQEADKVEIANQEAVKVACQIINTYSDLRQIDRALFTFCTTLRRFMYRPSILASQDAPWSLSPSLGASGFLVCAKPFLSAVALAVHSLPEGQVAEFIRLLTADTLESVTALAESMRSRQGGLESETDHSSNNLLSIIGLVELYSCVLENVNVTPTNSFLCCKAVGSFMNEVVTPNMGELIDSCVNSEKRRVLCAGSLDTGGRQELGKKKIGGSMMTWNVIFKVRLFMTSRGLHRQCMQLMPSKAGKKANIACSGYLIDYHKLDLKSVVSGLNAGIFFSAVGRDSVKVSDFLAGLKTKINENELSESPALDYTLDCIAMKSLVELARHVEAVSFLLMRYNYASHMPDGESVSSQLLREGDKPQPPSEAEDVGVELLKKMQKLLKSLKQESRRLAKTTLQGLPSFIDACQLVKIHSARTVLVSESSSKVGYRRDSDLTDCPLTPTRSSEIQWKQLIWEPVDATLTADCLTVRRWRLLCQTFDVWAKFAADEELKKFLSCLFACLMLTHTTPVSSRQKDGETPGPQITVMQQVAMDLLSNASFFEEESIRRLFASSFLEALKSLVCSAFGNWPFEWFTADILLEEGSLFRVASEFSDLIEGQVGGREEEEDLRAFHAKKSKSLVKKRKKWKIEAHELDMKALRNCIALIDHLSALPPGYMISSEATRCAVALQCFERLLVQSILHKRLTALDTLHCGNRTATVDCSDVLVVLGGLCSCRAAILALASTGLECSNHSGCSLLTVLSGSSALVQWPSQSLHAAAISLVDIVEHSNLLGNEKLNKLSLGQNLLHTTLKLTTALLTYIYNESLQPGGSKLYVNPNELASASSAGSKDPPKLAADGNDVVNMARLSFLDELLRLQGRKVDELVKKRIKAEQISNSDRREWAEGPCRGDFESWFDGLVYAASLCSYIWSVVSSFEKFDRGGLALENQVMLLLESGGKIDILGGILTKTLVRALVPEGSHAMLLVGENEVDRNLQWTALEAFEVKDGAVRLHTVRDGDSMKRDEDEEEYDEDDSQTTSDFTVPVKQDIQDESEEDEDVQRDDLRDIELVFKEEDQDKNAIGRDLEAADYSSKSATQRITLQTLLEGRSMGLCDLVGELYLAAAGFLKLEGLRLSRSKDASKFPGGLPPAGSVLLGAGYWILVRAAKQMRRGQYTSFGWLVGVVKYMESIGSLLFCMKSPLTASAFCKLFNMHLYLLGSLSPAEVNHRNQRLSQPFGPTDQVDVSIGVEMPPDGMRKVEGTSDSTLRETVRASLGLLMKTASRHHSVLALHAITRALVGASEDPHSASGLELCGQDSGKVGRGVAAGVQSLSVALEAVSGTKRLRLLANHFKEFSGATLNLIECLAGPKLFHEMGHHETHPTEVQAGMVQSAPVILRCIQIMTNVASRETIYPLEACHVALALHCPARIFSPVYQSGLRKHGRIRNFLALDDNSGAKQEKEIYPGILRIETDVGVELYVACCRLLCSLIRHRRRESGHCIALLGESARVLLHCLEATYWPLSDESTKVKSTRLAAYCATWLRRIYEEMGEHKETLGKYCCHILSHYLSVLAGHGTHAVGLTREVQAALKPGAYALVDACSANDLQQLHASLGEGPRRSALLALRREYTQQFKYTGKV